MHSPVAAAVRRQQLWVAAFDADLPDLDRGVIGAEDHVLAVGRDIGLILPEAGTPGASSCRPLPSAWTSHSAGG